MPSHLAWIDFSSADRERMTRAISLLSESETVDELGIGTIRDAFSDALFPGTSTIQTRLAYFLFVPWIWREIEEGKVEPGRALELGRQRERELIPALMESGDPEGVIGRVAGMEVKRLSSAVYWGGLQSWGIFALPQSLDQYVRALPEIRRRQRILEAERPDDRGIDPQRFVTWHPRLPRPPEGFHKEASFALRREDGEFLLGRLQSEPRCAGSMLAWLAAHARAEVVDTPWEHSRVRDLPGPIASMLELARRFSGAIQGARLLYKLLVWEILPRDDQAEQIESFREALAAWAEQERDEWSHAGPLDRAAMWQQLGERRARIPARTQAFVEAWVQALERHGPEAVADNRDVRRLIQAREVSLKGARSRFHNPRVRDQWGGASGRAPLSYRWSTVRTHLSDLDRALYPDEGAR